MLVCSGWPRSRNCTLLATLHSLNRLMITITIAAYSTYSNRATKITMTTQGGTIRAQYYYFYHLLLFVFSAQNDTIHFNAITPWWWLFPRLRGFLGKI